MTWERSRAWHLVRPLVYYLREDFVAPELAADADVLDFSAGLGDLSEYLVASGARSVVATRPESETPESDRTAQVDRGNRCRADRGQVFGGIV